MKDDEDDLTDADIKAIQAGFKKIVEATLDKGIPITVVRGNQIVRVRRVNGIETVEVVKELDKQNRNQSIT